MKVADRSGGFFPQALHSWHGLLCILAASFLYFLVDITRLVDASDEGIPVYGAERILNGDVPYRDFWTLYAPGQFYVLAGLFKMFGSSVLVERLYDTAARTLVSAAVFLTALRLASPGWGAVFWLVATLWLKYFGYPAYPNFPAIFFSLASLYVLLGFFHEDRPKTRLFLAGALAGLAGLFRQDSGFYLFFSEQLVVFPFAFFHLIPKNDGAGGLKRLAKLGPYVLAHLLGAALPILSVGIYFLSLVPANELVQDLIVFPLTVFPAVREIPFPGPLPDGSPLAGGEESFFVYLARLSERWSFYFSLLVFGAVFAFFAFGKHRPPGKGTAGRPAPIWSWQTGLFFVFGLFSFNNVRVRSDLPHLLPLFVSACLLSAALGPKLIAQVRIRKGFIWGALLLAGGLLLVYPVYRWRLPEVEEKFHPLFWGHDLERARHLGVNPNQVQAIHYIQSVTFPWEKIFVGNNRHDLIYNNDIMFYFLSGRHSATKYHELFPGLATSRAVQARIAEDLQRNNVRYIVRLSRFRNPGVTTEPVPVRLLDDFLAQNYRPVKTFGDWSVWESK